MYQKKLDFGDGIGGTALAIRVTPRANKNEITQVLSDGTIKITLAASPVQGKANLALIKFLAEILDISPANVEIIAGDKGNNKIVSIYGIDSDQVNKRLGEILESQK